MLHNDQDVRVLVESVNEESEDLLSSSEKKPTTCLSRFFTSIADFTKEYGGVEIDNQTPRMKSE